MFPIKRYSNAISSRLRHHADWRCQEPVIIFESDDWGLERRACADLVGRFGKPSEWAEETSETPEDLLKLYAVLASHVDRHGRAACITANFVVGNPDYEEIIAHQFEKYLEIPIGEDSALLAKWREGMERRVFFPQYHARYHQNVNAWLRDLRADEPGARELCARKCHGGLGLIKGRLWRYHSEYLDWSTGKDLNGTELRAMLASSLAIFTRVFGFSPVSTAAPHYLFTRDAAEAWQQVGIRYVQGTGYRILRAQDGNKRFLSHSLGEGTPEGLICLVRRIKFEPRPQRPDQGLKSALREIQRCFDCRIPAVLDTHRINFTGPWRDQALQSLGELLAATKQFKPLYLTSPELGEAVEQRGTYRDVWTGEPRRLTPIDPVWRRGLRGGFSRYHAAQVASA